MKPYVLAKQNSIEPRGVSLGMRCFLRHCGKLLSDCVPGKLNLRLNVCAVQQNIFHSKTEKS